MTVINSIMHKVSYISFCRALVQQLGSVKYLSSCREVSEKEEELLCNLTLSLAESFLTHVADSPSSSTAAAVFTQKNELLQL